MPPRALDNPSCLALLLDALDTSHPAACVLKEAALAGSVGALRVLKPLASAGQWEQECTQTGELSERRRGVGHRGGKAAGRVAALQSHDKQEDARRAAERPSWGRDTERTAERLASCPLPPAE